jgi:parvulin-like peptidyl-prolyl isomerase
LNRKSLAAILAVLIAATMALAMGCGDGLPGDAVAKVGETYITSEDLDEKVEAFASMYGLTKADSPEDYRDLETQVLKMIVQTAMAVQKAPQLGVTVTEERIEAEIDALAQDYFDGDRAALEQALKDQGQNLADLEKETRESLLTQKVRDEVTKGAASASAQEVEDYFQENKNGFITEPTLEARLILVALEGRPAEDATTTTVATESTTTTTTATGPSDIDWARALATASQVRLELLTGGDWTRLARQYSADEATKYSGGAVGPVAEGDLVEKYGQEFEDVLWTLAVDQISEPVETNTGYYVIQVTKTIAAREKTLEEAREEIVDILVGMAETEAWEEWFEATAAELGVVYRADLKPTTTAMQSPTTTVTP